MAARERAGLTALQAAERLHLDLATLQALEADRFETLGAAVFVRGHLRRYAELLAVPVSELDAAYSAAAGRSASLPDLRRIAPNFSGSPIQSATLPPRLALIGAIALVLIGLVWWALRVPRSQRATLSVPVAAAAGAPEHSGDGVGESTGAEGSVATAGALAVQTLAVEASAGPLPSGHVRLALRFNQDSWAEIYDANGARLMYELGAAGSQRHLEGLAPLHLLFGNPEGVTLELDGHPLALSAEAGSGATRRFSLDGGGRVVEVRAAQSGLSPQSLRP